MMRLLCAGWWVFESNVAAYDRTKPIVIDPVLLYSTYLAAAISILGLVSLWMGPARCM